MSTPLKVGHQSPKCLIVGAGEMGRAHSKAAFSLLDGNVAVWAPSGKNKKAVIDSGIAFIEKKSLSQAVELFSPSHVILAAPVDELVVNIDLLLDLGVPNILVEKPGVLNLSSGRSLSLKAAHKGANIYVAYNRRFYASVRTAREMIAKSGETINSIYFEFTEWSDVVRGLKNQSPLTKMRWLLANSMHVIDLAFLPTGLPQLNQSLFIHTGRLDWHPSASLFSGAGLTLNGVPFSYHANWDAPGRWGVEWMTPSTRYIFRPMEGLCVTKRGSTAIIDVPLMDDLDERFKPGVYLQDQEFFTGGGQFLPRLEKAISLVELSCNMAGYPEE